MLRIAFRADGGRRLGLGHLARCRSLARALARRADCRFVFLSEDPELASGFAAVGLDARAETPGVAAEGAFDILIADRPGLSGTDTARLRAACRILAVIDDDPDSHPACDLRVIPNLAAPESAAGPEARLGFLAGGRYLLLDPDYADEPRAGSGEALLVSFGGSDPGGFGLRFWPAWERLSGLAPVRLAAGAACPDRDALGEKAAGHSRISLAPSAPGLLGEYRKAKAAVLAGGMQMYEACGLGLPACILSCNPEQAAEAARAAERGAILDGGMGQAATVEGIVSSLSRLLADTRLRDGLSEAGRRMVATDGASRVAAALLAAHADAGRRQP